MGLDPLPTGPATFHPNGKLLFQARDDDIDVYIIR